jgi:low affinity Fe/Cu permease
MPMSLEAHFTNIANAVAHAAGQPAVFAICCLSILIWGLSGPIFDFSDSWQLIINTGTTVVTFLMVFLIQTPRIGTQLRSTPNWKSWFASAMDETFMSASSALHKVMLRS